MADSFTVMVVGGGAREHTISEAYEKSPGVDKIVVAPGNDFISYKRNKEVITEKCFLKQPQSILKVADKYKPDLVDVAQDDALAGGTVDLLSKNNFTVFGPNKCSSKIEWDKIWSRKFMERNGIPTPKFSCFDSKFAAKNYAKYLFENYNIEGRKGSVFIKAKGLTGGKGALEARNLDEAIDNIEKMDSFGDAGKRFVIEEGLVGEEFSTYAISDGENYHIFKSAQDNKRIFNFDKGKQTGGMGAISPAMVTEPIKKEIDERLIERAIKGMNKEGNRYRGILYLGGIASDDVSNIEYNARWGDPECQVVLPSVKTDYLEMVMSAVNGDLDMIDIKEDEKTRVCVVGASKGYPTDYSDAKGKRIYGIDEAMKMDGIKIYGAGIKMEDDKRYANGGRLFSMVGEGKDIAEAKKKAYSAIACVNIEGNNLHYRTDIGWRDVERHLKEKHKL